MSRKTDAVIARTIGIDTGKNTLHLIGLDDNGAIVLREKVSRVTGSARTVWFALSTQSRARVSVRPPPLVASLGSRAADIDSSRPPPQECVAPVRYRPW